MKKALLWVMLIAVSIALPLDAQVKKSAVVMTVNEEPIFSWEVNLTVPQVQKELAGQGAPPKREDVINLALQRIVDTRLLAEEARRRNLRPDRGRVESAMAKIEEQAGGPEGLQKALDGIGATHDQLRASVSETDLVQVFMATQIEPGLSVKAEDVRAYYNANPELFDRPEMVRARHILIRLTPNSTTADKKEARTRAQAAHQRVVAGEDFAVVAGQVSEGREASQGGDMGFFARESMMPELTNVAFALEVDQISDIIETRFGFHILKVEEKRAASHMSFAEAEGPVQERLRGNQAGEMLKELLLELKEKATVVVMTPPEPTTANPNGG